MTTQRKSIDDLADELEGRGYSPVADRLRDGMSVADELAFLRDRSIGAGPALYSEPIGIIEAWEAS
jgi:hypothetical protein